MPTMQLEPLTVFLLLLEVVGVVVVGRGVVAVGVAAFLMLLMLDVVVGVVFAVGVLLLALVRVVDGGGGVVLCVSVCRGVFSV